MRNYKLIFLLLAGGALLAACTRPANDAGGGSATTSAASNESAVAVVNGKPIGAEVFDVFLRAVTGKPAAEATPEQKEQLLDQLVNMSLAAQAAEKDGLGKDPAIQARIDLLTTQILAEAATEKYDESHPLTEEEIRAEYDQQIAGMPQEYKARHILVENKEAAESIISKLQAGGDFAKLAAAESKDSGSAKQGGDLGWFAPQSMVKPFADAVMGLEKGALTTAPVQSDFGWHVIQLEDVRSPEPPAYEDVKQQVEMIARRKKLQTYLDELRNNAEIEKKM
jgi:peptidyl-prolyl cis-trans isomerase C